MKKIIFFAVIIACLSVIYYFGLFLPTQAKQEQEHKLQIECKKLGEQIDKDVNRNIDPDAVYKLTPEYYFNPKLKKCFYCGGIVGAEVIIDAYTNKEIADSFFDSKRDWHDNQALQQRRIYDMQKAKLFDKE